MCFRVHNAPLVELDIALCAITRVVKVTEKDVEVLDKKTKQTSLLPYGLVLWSTGVAPLPLTKVMCEALPEQNNKLVYMFVCVCLCVALCV